MSNTNDDDTSRLNDSQAKKLAAALEKTAGKGNESYAKGKESYEDEGEIPLMVYDVEEVEEFLSTVFTQWTTMLTY